MSYGTVSRLFHWIMGVMILVMIPVGMIMTREGLDRATQDALFILHKNMGALLLVLIVLRIVWRLVNPPPALPDHMPAGQKIASRAVHFGLYAAIVVMAASGYARVRMGGFPIEYVDAMGIGTLLPESEAGAATARAIHANVKWVLMALIGLHVAAAIYHGAVLRDGIMQRMWPPVAPREQRQVG